ncbi:MAG TPA: hypothetical protein DDY68_05820, partial [Porphyromonadaceae bacterium]|nr:hypothetical protein [Porphyromonadaceae bacterium]
EISSPNGKISLTIPIEKPSKGETMKDIRIANYGHWNHLHWQALSSAYGKSPFFEYYAEEYAPIFESPNKFLVDFNEKLLQTTLKLLYTERTIHRTEEYLPSYPIDYIDLREKIHPKKSIEETLQNFSPIPYYQVFRE